MCEHCASGEAIVDAAITEGRIDLASREMFLRTFEMSPDLVVDTLAATKPDTITATRNYVATLSDDEQLAYRADAERRFGIPMAEVV